MPSILYVVSILWLSAGVCLILYTAETCDFLKNLMRHTDPRLLAILPALFGTALLVAGGASHYPWFLRLLGVLALAKAAFLVFDLKGLRQRVVNRFTEQTGERTCRLWGIVVVILATALFSWVR